MALAEPALRYHIRTRVKFRGSSLLGSVIGAGIAIGDALYRQYELTLPWAKVEQPERGQRAFVGRLDDGSQDVSSNQQ